MHLMAGRLAPASEVAGKQTIPFKKGHHLPILKWYGMSSCDLWCRSLGLIMWTLVQKVNWQECWVRLPRKDCTARLPGKTARQDCRVGWWCCGWCGGVGYVVGWGCGGVGCVVVWGAGAGSPLALEHSKVCTLCYFGHLQFYFWMTSNSGLKGHRRTYLTILELADHALFKMVRNVLLRPLRPELYVIQK
jgi:hypothetical protein